MRIHGKTFDTLICKEEEGKKSPQGRRTKRVRFTLRVFVKNELISSPIQFETSLVILVNALALEERNERT